MVRNVGERHGPLVILPFKHMYKLILLLIAVSAASAQVSVTVSPVPKIAAQRILSKRVLKSIMIWTPVIQNDSAGPVSISESAILHRISQLSPIDHQSMSLLIDEAQTNSAWARAGRAAGDVGKLGAFLAASRTIKISDPWMTGLTGALALLPYITQRLQGAERPVRQNFEALAWTQPITLHPGESAATRIFTAVWGDPKPVSFVIDISKLASAKLVQ